MTSGNLNSEIHPNYENTPVNSVVLAAQKESKITDISLYSGRAEITRLFRLTIKEGENIVTIGGLPRALQQDSLKVEGQGNASIHDVRVSAKLCDPIAGRKEAKFDLRRRRDETRKALESKQQTRAALTSYLGAGTQTLGDTTDLARLEALFNNYDILSKRLDSQVLDLEKDLGALEGQLRGATSWVARQGETSFQAVINIVGTADEEISLFLKYFVINADWSASYDVRVDTTNEKLPIVVSYKAIINQNTGESWDSVPLTLETTTPSFGLSVPKLSPWRLNIYQQPPRVIMGPPICVVPQPCIIQAPRYSPASPSLSDRSSPSPPPIIQPAMTIQDKGLIAATFRVPGLISVPSDGDKHNVSIVQLALEATMLRYTIPKVDARIQLKAKIKNDSQYSFIGGPANIYVDKSYVGTTSISPVNSQESFECPLGFDPTIRVTYHPLEKKGSQSGFYLSSKNNTQLFTQHITIINTKSIPIANLKVIDQVPVSQDERIGVKLLDPLLLPVAKGGNEIVKVADGIIAQWSCGEDAPGTDPMTVGLDGRLDWTVSVPAQGSRTLALRYEISYPNNLVVTGL